MNRSKLTLSSLLILASITMQPLVAVVETQTASPKSAALLNQQSRTEKIKAYALTAAGVVLAAGTMYIAYDWYRDYSHRQAMERDRLQAQQISERQRRLTNDAQAWYAHAVEHADQAHLQDVEHLILAADTHEHPYASYVDGLEHMILNMEQAARNTGADAQTREDLQAQIPGLRRLRAYIAIHLHDQLQRDRKAQKRDNAKQVKMNLEQDKNNIERQRIRSKETRSFNKRFYPKQKKDPVVVINNNK